MRTKFEYIWENKSWKNLITKRLYGCEDMLICAKMKYNFYSDEVITTGMILLDTVHY